MSRISKLTVWKCSRCKTFNEDFMDECECGFLNRAKKKKEEDRIEDFKFPNRGFSDEIFR